MNKQELISSVADASGLTKADASKAVEGVFDAITGALKKGDEVRLVGFGTFSVKGRSRSPLPPAINTASIGNTESCLFRS